MADIFAQFRDPGIVEEDIDLLIAENEEQIKKWGIQEHSLFEWLAYTTEELGELSQAISEYTYRDGKRGEIAREALQVATLALKVALMVDALL